MKKRLMAMLVAAAMLVCMMPAMAFADETPAEEQTVQVTEEVVVPEAAEEEAVAPEAEGAVLEEEAVVEEAVVEENAEYDGYWSGSTFYFTGNEAGAADCVLVANHTKVNDFVIKVGANDCSSVLEELAADCVSIALSVHAKSEDFYKPQNILMLKTKVVVDKAASKDTIFTYEVDSVVIAKETRTGGTEFVLVDPSEITDYEFDFYGNTITLKAGETTAEGYLQVSFNGKSKTTKLDYSPYGGLIKEKGNDGGYATDSSFGAWTGFSTEISETGHMYARFASRAAAQAFLDEMSVALDTKSADEVIALYSSTFNLTELTFTHTAKGVQTGDSNSLGLWVVVMAVAGVAAAAVALKRREN